MARPKRFKKQEVVDALVKAHGLKTVAAELLGADVHTIDRYCDEHPECQAVVDHWKKRRVDRAEYKLDEAIERGEAWAIALVLKTTGKERGYVERQEIKHEIDTVKAFDYGDAIAPLASRSVPDSDASGDDQGGLHGEEMGQDSDGG